MRQFTKFRYSDEIFECLHIYVVGNEIVEIITGLELRTLFHCWWNKLEEEKFFSCFRAISGILREFYVIPGEKMWALTFYLLFMLWVVKKALCALGKFTQNVCQIIFEFRHTLNLNIEVKLTQISNRDHTVICTYVDVELKYSLKHAWTGNRSRQTHTKIR